jgi:hypothetical protein
MSARDLLNMETYTKLYLDFAAEHRQKAEASTDSHTREALLKVVMAYELAAEAIQTYPEEA